MLGAVNALLLWVVLMLGLAIVWLLIAWLIGLVWSLDIGLSSPHGTWVVIAAAPASALYAVWSSVRWVKTGEGDRAAIREDIEKAEVLIENHRVLGVKRFQEPEHGGQFYFLRMSDDKVLVLFDHESQDIGADGNDSLLSSFQPRAELTIVRAPATGHVIEQTFSGAAMTAEETLELVIPPDQWPDEGSWCDIPWDDLAARLST